MGVWIPAYAGMTDYKASGVYDAITLLFILFTSMYEGGLVVE